jgi:IS30 family transposase
MAYPRRKLTVFDRSMIEVRLRDGLSTRAIARDLGRSAGMISDEINRHGGKKATGHGGPPHKPLWIGV